MAILLAVFPLFMRWICCGHHMAMSVHLSFFCSAVCVGLRRIAWAVASKDPSNAAAERFRAAGKHGRNGRYLTGATETAGWTARKKLHGRKKKHEQAQSFEGRDRSGRIRSDARRIAAIGNGNAKTKSGSPMASMWPNLPDSTAMQCFPTSSRTSPATWSPLPTAPLRSPACVSRPPRSAAENLK